MDGLNREELARLMAQRVDGLSQRLACAALTAALEEMSEILAKGGTIRLHEFGNFGIRRRSARQVRHPRTGELLLIPAARVAFFNPAQGLQQRVNQEEG